MTDLELLIATRDVLQERGWTRFHFGTKRHGPHCLVGAGTLAAGIRRYSVIYAIRVTRLERRLSRLLGLDEWNLFYWNDTRLRKFEVIERLNEAIEREQRKAMPRDWEPDHEPIPA